MSGVTFVLITANIRQGTVGWLLQDKTQQNVTKQEMLKLHTFLKIITNMTLYHNWDPTLKVTPLDVSTDFSQIQRCNEEYVNFTNTYGEKHGFSVPYTV